MKTTITQTEYYALLGVLTVVKRYTTMLSELEAVVAEIIGEEKDQYGGYNWASDAIYSNDDADMFLHHMGITVQEDPAL